MARTSRKNLPEVTAAAAPECLHYNAAAYVRLSSDDRKKRGDSLETQRHIIERFVAENSDIHITEIYSDNNKTGTSFDRPGFQKMLADIDSGRINCVIVKDLTRFGRNAIDAGYYLDKYLPSRNVRFIAITDNHDSNDGDGGIILPLKNVLAESYALDISRKCRAVQRQNIADGRFIGRLAPYGYAKSQADCHKLVVNPETAPVLRQIFDWAANGIGFGEITRRLNEAEILTPSRYAYSKGYCKSEKLLGSGLWTRRTVMTILADLVYVGDMVQGKSRCVNNERVDVPQSEWVCVPNTHEPLVSREQFEHVQQSKKAIAPKTEPYTPNILRGKIFCAHCGHAMNRKRQNKDGTYWFRCESQWRYKESACTLVSAKEADVLDAILTEFRTHNREVCAVALQLERKMPQISEKLSANEHEASRIRAQLAQTVRFKKSLYESLASGDITADEYAEMKAEYARDIDRLRERADTLERERLDFEQCNDENYGVYEQLRYVTVRGDITAELINALVEKILVSRDKSVNVVLKAVAEYAEAA